MNDPKPEPSRVQLRVIETPEHGTLRRMEIDLHGHHPREVDLETLLKQVWETGVDDVVLVHGHGRARGRSVGFLNTKTGYFGLCVRATIRGNPRLKPWVKISTLDCRSWGSTTVKLKPNPKPTRSEIDLPACIIGPDDQKADGADGAPRPPGASRWPSHKSRKRRSWPRSRRKRKKRAAAAAAAAR